MTTERINATLNALLSFHVDFPYRVTFQSIAFSEIQQEEAVNALFRVEDPSGDTIKPELFNGEQVWHTAAIQFQLSQILPADQKAFTTTVENLPKRMEKMLQDYKNKYDVHHANASA